MVTRPQTAEMAVPEALGATRIRHFQRVRSMFDDPNIVGAGVTEKVSDGETVDTLSLCFYVREKLPVGEVNPANMLPPVLAAQNGEAVFTDVVEIGDVVPQATALPLVRRNPIQSGYSVGHFSTSAGTIGAVVTRAGRKYLLSNSHVLADSGNARRGDAIYFPGPRDGGTHSDTVAQLKYFKPFTEGEGFPNRVDAALAEIITDKLTDVNYRIHGAKTPLQTGVPERNMKVVVMGRTSGVKKSIVRDADFRIQVSYDTGTFGFSGQVRCDTYSTGGDSGSIVVDESTGAIVGLHFAGAPKGSVFTPIRTVMRNLRFTFDEGG